METRAYVRSPIHAKNRRLLFFTHSLPHFNTLSPSLSHSLIRPCSLVCSHLLSPDRLLFTSSHRIDASSHLHLPQRLTHLLLLPLLSYDPLIIQDSAFPLLSWCFKQHFYHSPLCCEAAVATNRCLINAALLCCCKTDPCIFIYLIIFFFYNAAT